MAQYKITIEKIEVITQKKRDWLKLTDTQKNSDTQTSTQYGYGPEIDFRVSETTRIYEQTLNDMNVNIGEVIKVINGL